MVFNVLNPSHVTSTTYCLSKKTLTWNFFKPLYFDWSQNGTGARRARKQCCHVGYGCLVPTRQQNSKPRASISSAFDEFWLTILSGNNKWREISVMIEIQLKDQKLYFTDVCFYPGGWYYPFSRAEMIKWK